MAVLGGAAVAGADPVHAELGRGEHKAVDWQPMRVHVVQPRMRHGHTEYKIVVYDKKSGREVHHCRRRFNDFLVLLTPVWSAARRAKISLPPLPSKQYFGRFDRGFVEQRRLLLNQCLESARAHPRLAAMPEFEVLTDVDAEMMADYRRMLMEYRLEIQKHFFAAAGSQSGTQQQALEDNYVRETLLKIYPHAHKEVDDAMAKDLSGVITKQALGRIEDVVLAIENCRKAHEALGTVDDLFDRGVSGGPPMPSVGLGSAKGLEDLLGGGN